MGGPREIAKWTSRAGIALTAIFYAANGCAILAIALIFGLNAGPALGVSVLLPIPIVLSELCLVHLFGFILGLTLKLKLKKTFPLEGK